MNASPGEQLEIPLTVEKGGDYELIGFFTRANDYGIFQLSVNGNSVGELIDGFSPDVEPSGPISFGRLDLNSGTNQLVVKLLGKDSRSAGFSDGYLVGIDGFYLRNIEQ